MKRFVIKRNSLYYNRQIRRFVKEINLASTYSFGGAICHLKHFSDAQIVRIEFSAVEK